MAVKITTSPTNGGTATVTGGNITVNVTIDEAATVNTWMVLEGTTLPIPGVGPLTPTINHPTAYTFTAASGQRYDVNVQANNSLALVTLKMTVAT